MEEMDIPPTRTATEWQQNVSVHSPNGMQTLAPCKPLLNVACHGHRPTPAKIDTSPVDESFNHIPTRLGKPPIHLNRLQRAQIQWHTAPPPSAIPPSPSGKCPRFREILLPMKPPPRVLHYVPTAATRGSCGRRTGRRRRSASRAGSLGASAVVCEGEVAWVEH